MNGFMILIFALLFAGCSHFNRSPQSGYGLKSSHFATRSPAQTESSKQVLRELGLSPQALNNREFRQLYQEHLELRELEKTLVNEREKRQYYEQMPYFRDKKMQIDFLKQPGFFARQNWLMQNKMNWQGDANQRELEKLAEEKDISLGMTQELVRRSWGKPDAIEVAGNPLYRNERWIYQGYQASSEGYELQSRRVYFEGGRVVGWDQGEAN